VIERRPFLAGNWKMHKTIAQSVDLARGLAEAIGAETERDVAVFPPLTALSAVIETLKDSPILVGAQTCHFEEKGAFTGEVSAEMLKDAGSDLVLVGHSERRQLFGETDEIVRRKLDAALRAELSPVLCLGETLEERNAGHTEDVIRRQAIEAFKGLTPDEMMSITIAYEPVWAIGTGLTATPEQAQEVHAFLRDILKGFFGELSAQLRIQYGGSVKPDNIARLMSEPDLDGALVGGASLTADSFAGIVLYGRG
jgi:triosephosphate isomerase (TIM)